MHSLQNIKRASKFTCVINVCIEWNGYFILRHSNVRQIPRDNGDIVLVMTESDFSMVSYKLDSSWLIFLERAIYVIL